jgi:hypothetical protein
MKGRNNMIKYFINEEKRQVIGLLDGTEWDAINKINKMMLDTHFCFCASEQYMMPSEFRAVVQCDERDEFIPEVGMRYAKERIMSRYYASLDKRVSKFFEEALIFNGKIFETPKELENNT